MTLTDQYFFTRVLQGEGFFLSWLSQSQREEFELPSFLFFFFSTENLDDLQQVVQERLSELVRVLKAVIGKHQTLNSSDILGAAGMVIAKVKGQ